MTKRELSQLLWLNREMIDQHDRIAELEEYITDCTAQLSDMPKARGKQDQLAACVAEIADLKELLNLNQQKRGYEIGRLYRFIDNIEDAYIRIILSMRHIHGMDWQQVARVVGGGNTADSVRMAHDRFLRQSERKKKS